MIAILGAILDFSSSKSIAGDFKYVIVLIFIEPF